MQRDLFEAIEHGDFPKWRVAIQIMPEAEAENYKVNPFDLTKIWSHKDYPLVDVGVWNSIAIPEIILRKLSKRRFLRWMLCQRWDIRPTKCCRPA
jgi:catalase